MSIRCPFGDDGDRLWVRETWMQAGTGALFFRADGNALADGYAWRSSTTMTRDASRLTLDVVSVGVERLHSITEQDVLAEGAPHARILDDGYAARWDARFGKRAPWSSNPWTWRGEVRRAVKNAGGEEKR